MRSLWLGLCFVIALTVSAAAQGCGPSNPNCIVPTAPLGTNTNQAASTAFVQAAVTNGITAPQYDFLIGNASNIAAPTALSGDCTFGASGIVCTKTNGIAFAPSATTDTTNAGNISSGTLAGARVAAVNLAAGGNGGVTGNLPNANLANPATTVNGQTCTLGSTCTITASGSALVYAPLAQMAGAM